MKTIFFFCTALVAAYGGCTFIENDDADYDERSSPVLQQRVIAKGRTEVTFSVVAQWNNSCGTFSRSDVAAANSVVTIRIIGKQPKNASCYHAFTNFPADVPVTGLRSGDTLSFRFWQSDTTSIDTTIVM